MTHQGPATDQTVPAPAYHASPTTFVHNNFEYTRKEAPKGTITTYRCKYNRNQNSDKCPVTLKMDHTDQSNISKSREAYYMVLMKLAMASNWKLDPGTITCDYEMALINSVKETYQNATIVGCLFHFKQALRRKLIDIGIAKEELKLFMESGKLDVLTIIPRAEIVEFGIPYLRSFESREQKGKWNIFWKYFLKTWVTVYEIKDWNIHGVVESDEVRMVNRTNNPLESYNRFFQESIGKDHPPLETFVEVIADESNKFVQKITDVRNRHDVPRPRNDLNYPEIPLSYENFKSNMATIP
jgi:hypothetical protein